MTNNFFNKIESELTLINDQAYQFNCYNFGRTEIIEVAAQEIMNCIPTNDESKCIYHWLANRLREIGRLNLELFKLTQQISRLEELDNSKGTVDTEFSSVADTRPQPDVDGIKAEIASHLDSLLELSHDCHATIERNRSYLGHTTQAPHKKTKKRNPKSMLDAVVKLNTFIHRYSIVEDYASRSALVGHSLEEQGCKLINIITHLSSVEEDLPFGESTVYSIALQIIILNNYIERCSVRKLKIHNALKKLGTGYLKTMVNEAAILIK